VSSSAKKVPVEQKVELTVVGKLRTKLMVPCGVMRLLRVLVGIVVVSVLTTQSVAPLTKKSKVNAPDVTVANSVVKRYSPRDVAVSVAVASGSSCPMLLNVSVCVKPVPISPDC
jgi:hypothetical protein